MTGDDSGTQETDVFNALENPPVMAYCPECEITLPASYSSTQHCEDGEECRRVSFVPIEELEALVREFEKFRETDEPETMTPRQVGVYYENRILEVIETYE